MRRRNRKVPTITFLGHGATRKAFRTCIGRPVPSFCSSVDRRYIRVRHHRRLVHGCLCGCHHGTRTESAMSWGSGNRRRRRRCLGRSFIFSVLANFGQKRQGISFSISILGLLGACLPLGILRRLLLFIA